MKKHFHIRLWFFILVLALGLGATEKRWTLDLEAGPVFAGYNTIQVPNPQGTRFSLSDDFDVSKRIYYRLRLSYLIARRHALSALFAPLSLEASGEPAQALIFQDATFFPGKSVDALYRFNSYRLTYRYLLVNRPTLDLWIGFTAKIRDAEIRLTSSQKQAATTNVGFVPLLHLMLDWKWHCCGGMLFELDALAAPGGQGRAEDGSACFYFLFSNNMKARLGYRFVEGGANVETVYNFALLHYIFISLQVRF